MFLLLLQQVKLLKLLPVPLLELLDCYLVYVAAVAILVTSSFPDVLDHSLLVLIMLGLVPELLPAPCDVGLRANVVEPAFRSSCLYKY